MHTEVAFTLPRGYVDERGAVHREGVMRLATARDELEPLGSAEVRDNEAYFTVLLLARTVVRIGEITRITPEVIEGLWASDFGYLQHLYEWLNGEGGATAVVTCPACAQEIEIDLAGLDGARVAG